MVTKVIEKYELEGKLIHIKSVNSGNINKTYTDGYMSGIAQYITQEELSLVSESIRIITLELAMWFLNDYINGDTYFKIIYPTYNLDRARNQLVLVKDIENKMDDIKVYISESYKKTYQPINRKIKSKSTIIVYNLEDK